MKLQTDEFRFISSYHHLHNTMLQLICDACCSFVWHIYRGHLWCFYLNLPFLSSADQKQKSAAPPWTHSESSWLLINYQSSQNQYLSSVWASDLPLVAVTPSSFVWSSKPRRPPGGGTGSSCVQTDRRRRRDESTWGTDWWRRRGNDKSRLGNIWVHTFIIEWFSVFWSDRPCQRTPAHIDDLTPCSDTKVTLSRSRRTSTATRTKFSSGSGCRI